MSLAKEIVMPRYVDLNNPKIIKLGRDRYGDVMYHIPPDLPTVDVVEIKKDGEWEMFDLISSAYYGKRMYFKEDDGIVYSRYSCKYMSVDEAIREFVSLIDGSEIDVPERNVGEWIDTGSGEECSVCNEIQYGYDNYRNYCANCGSRNERRE